MDPSQYVILTTIALKAARDCRSKKVRKRLQAAMNAVLAPEHRQVDEETALMSSLAGTIKVVDDITAENLQKELYGLGRISSLMQVTPEGGEPDAAAMAGIEADMPAMPDRIGILLVWERMREEHGLFRADPDALGDFTLDLPPIGPKE